MKRRKFTAKFKTNVALAAIKEHQSLTELAQKYKLAPTQISKWKKEFLTGAEMVFEGGKKPEKNAEETERNKLLQTIGALKVENDFLKKSLGKIL